MTTRVYVGFDSTPQAGFDVTLNLGEHVYTGHNDFGKRFGSVTSLEDDLLNLGAGILAVDRGLRRGEREDFARRVEISLPIVNIARIQPLVPAIERVLRLLANDYWK